MDELILVVDDDVALVEAMTATLESVGYRVATATNVEDAVEAARREPPDLAILDVMLATGGEGFHLAYDMRRDNRLAHIPIIMLSGIHRRTHFRFSPDSDGEFLPVERFLEKPVDPAVLLDEVAAVLAEHRDGGADG
ncbi:MAG: response regulator [Candidatus Brocadiia bacterium]